MIVDELACCFCPAHRFRSRAELAEHERGHRLAEFATIPRDPLAVLREAIVWAIDEGALRLIPAEFQLLLEPTRLRSGKPAPGFPASLIGGDGGVTVRARITEGGRELHVHLSIQPREFARTRVHLPAQFALAAVRQPVLRDSRTLAERLADAAERGLENEPAQVLQ